MQTVLIVGGVGFVGSNIARQFLETGYKVVVFDSFIQYLPEQKVNYGRIMQQRLEGIEDQIISVRGDARNRSEIENPIREHKPDIIIQLASLPISTLSNIHVEEAVSSCIISSMNILESIRAVGCTKRFVYTSSSMVYGDFKADEALEDSHPTNPKDVYAGTKLAGENFVKAYCKRFDIDYTIIRPSAVYGPTDINQRVVQIFVENAIQGKELVLQGGGESKLDFTFVKDTARGFFLAATVDKAKNETFNITAGHSRSLKELVEILKQHFPNLKVRETPSDPYRPKRGTLNIDKAKQLLGFEPAYDLEKGIAEYVAHMKKQI